MTIEDAVAQRPARSPWQVFRIASIAVFLVSIDATVLYAAFPALRRAFSGATPADLSWVLNAYTVVYAALLVPAGRVADLRGRKRMFLAGLGVFLAASLCCGLAGSVETLIAMRALQAVGAALLLPASLSIVLAAFPAERRAVVVSLWGAVAALASAVGPSLGSFLVDRWGWQWAFFLNLPPGIWAIWRGARLLDESRRPELGARLDLVGVVLLIAAAGGIALGVVRSEALGWASSGVVLAVAGGLAALGAFIAWARRVPAPAIDLSLFRDPTYRSINLATLSFGIAFAVMFFQNFLFTTGIWHYSVARAGLAGSPGPLFVIPTSILAGRLAARIGHKPLLVIGSLVFALGGIWFAVIPGVEPDYLRAWLPGQLLNGVGVGMVMPSLAGAAVAHLPPAQFGVGSAVNQAVRQMGAVLGVALTVALVGHAALDRSDFRTLYVCQIALALVTAVLCAPVDTRPRPVIVVSARALRRAAH
ncbi:MAG TPA: MFS transporter [Kofleriaceae bacterium]|jgi:EmrB/QacA subfamily drug resistance transporter|nr:MFS transporter [Kofleriaceae bacterium]